MRPRSEESIKRRKLECEVKTLKSTTKKQAKVIARLKTGRKENSRGSSFKSWSQYSRQQQYNKRKSLASSIQGAVSFFEDEGFKPYSVEVENVDTGQHEVIDIASGAYSQTNTPTSNMKDNTRSILYIRQNFHLK